MSAVVELASFGGGAALGLVSRGARLGPAREVLSKLALLGALALGAITAALVWQIGPPPELDAPILHALELLAAFLASIYGFSLASGNRILVLVRKGRVTKRL